MAERHPSADAARTRAPHGCSIEYRVTPEGASLRFPRAGLRRINKVLPFAAVLWTAMVLFLTLGFVRGSRADASAFSVVGLLIFIVGFWGTEVGLLLATAHAVGRQGRIDLSADRLVIETSGQLGRRRMDEPWNAIRDVAVFAVGSGPVSLMVSLASGRYSAWFGGWPRRELESAAEQIEGFRRTPKSNCPVTDEFTPVAPRLAPPAVGLGGAGRSTETAATQRRTARDRPAAG
jgi:hypothetical protein